MKTRIINNKTQSFILLYYILFLYSFSAVFSKLASKQDFFSPLFFAYYSGSILLLFIYALLWQRVLKHVPLATAYGNKSITAVLGMFWGYIFFSEPIKWNMILGAAVVVFGVCWVVKSDE